MMTNVMVKTWIEQKIIKNSNPIQAMKNSVCPTANVIRRPIFRSFRIVDSTNDMIIVKWHLLNFTKAEFVRIFTEYLLNVPKCGLNTRHDNREVTLILLTRAQTLRSDKCATGSIHANGSMTINVIPCLLFCRSGLCLALWAIHICSKLQATTILAGITIHWTLRRIFSKIFCVSNDDKCYGENMNSTENYKKFESDSGNEE